MEGMSLLGVAAVSPLDVGSVGVAVTSVPAHGFLAQVLRGPTCAFLDCLVDPRALLKALFPGACV